MRYAYFPGCSANSTGISYTMSIAYVADRLGIELLEIPDWCCCGTSAARLTDADLALALPARSLALSEKMDPELDVVAPCSGCYSSLKASAHYARRSEKDRKHVEDLIGMPYQARSEVLDILDILLTPEATAALQVEMTRRFAGLKVACYYGCALVRPVGMCQPDDPENPQAMDRLVAATGAEPVQWAFKTECCGASNHISYPRGAKQMVARIFRDAVENGADVIVTACPLCWMNLDMREDEVNRLNGTSYDVPVYYITELIGAALGGTPEQLGTLKHFRPADRLFQALEDVEAPAASAAEAQGEVVA